MIPLTENFTSLKVPRKHHNMLLLYASINFQLHSPLGLNWKAFWELPPCKMRNEKEGMEMQLDTLDDGWLKWENAIFETSLLLLYFSNKFASIWTHVIKLTEKLFCFGFNKSAGGVKIHLCQLRWWLKHAKTFFIKFDFFQRVVMCFLMWIQNYHFQLSF